MNTKVNEFTKDVDILSTGGVTYSSEAEAFEAEYEYDSMFMEELRGFVKLGSSDVDEYADWWANKRTGETILVTKPEEVGRNDKTLTRRQHFVGPKFLTFSNDTILMHLDSDLEDQIAEEDREAEEAYKYECSLTSFYHSAR